jgi:hypothetical protein
MANRGCVYFMHNGQFCKIGHTTRHLVYRFHESSVWSPTQLEVVGWIASENADQLEQQIHLELSHLRLVKPGGNGEWFKLTKTETEQYITTHNGKLKHYTHSNASRHPAHNVRSVCRRQHDKASAYGQNLRRQRSVFDTSPKRIFAISGPEHAIGGKAFLRQAVA